MLIRAETCRSGGAQPSALISQQIIFNARAIRKTGVGVVERKEEAGGGEFGEGEGHRGPA